MDVNFFSEATEKWLIETIQKNGLEWPFLIALSIWGVSLLAGGAAGWFLSGILRVADLRKTLAEAGKIEGEVASQKELLLKSIRETRDALQAVQTRLTEQLRELRTRLQNKQKVKSDEAREAVCHCVNSEVGPALETHCERIEYLLSRRLRSREVVKTIIPCAETICGALAMINLPELMTFIGDRKPLLLKSAGLAPLFQTVRSVYPWWKPWTWLRRYRLLSQFKPHLRKT